MQSILATLMFFSLRVVAASSYSGARALQWPHHGAKTIPDHPSARKFHILLVIL